PRLVCDAPVHDFGSVPDTAPVEHDFDIRNDGQLSLQILSVRASCGCTAVNASQDVIPPGGTAAIHATFTTANRSGAQIKTITVTSNDPDSPTTLLTLRGTVVKPLSANPAAVYYGRVSGPSAATREVVLTSSAPCRIASLSLASPHLRATADAPDAPATTHRIVLEILPDMPRGPFGDTLTIATDSAVESKLLVPVTGFWIPADDPESAAP
ncbi:MAG: DUF1573 domain-containing protein, partial [Kiritimatiellae bacterium]|nr:DUF1573 domain-containing protein [Kiritimatiellia bacterium]